MSLCCFLSVNRKLMINVKYYVTVLQRIKEEWYNRKSFTVCFNFILLQILWLVSTQTSQLSFHRFKVKGWFPGSFTYGSKGCNQGIGQTDTYFPQALLRNNWQIKIMYFNTVQQDALIYIIKWSPQSSYYQLCHSLSYLFQIYNTLLLTFTLL
jgi:hypothetical protein